MELYEKYQKAQDIEKIMSLFYQNGSPEFIIETQRKIFPDFMKLKIDNIKIQPIPSDKKNKIIQGFPYQDQIIVPNLEPLNEMVVQFDLEAQGDAKITDQTIMIGKEGRTHYFVMSKFKEKE